MKDKESSRQLWITVCSFVLTILQVFSNVVSNATDETAGDFTSVIASLLLVFDFASGMSSAVESIEQSKRDRRVIVISSLTIVIVRTLVFLSQS